MTSTTPLYDTQALLQGLDRPTIVKAHKLFNILEKHASEPTMNEEALLEYWQIGKPKDVQVKNEAAGVDLANAMTGVSEINKMRELQSNGQPSLQMFVSLRGSTVTKGERLHPKPADRTQKAQMRSNAAATHAASSATPLPPAVFQITVQGVTGMSILQSEEAPDQAPGPPPVGMSEFVTEFLASAGPWGKPKGSDGLSQCMAPLAGSAFAHHSYDLGYKGVQAPSGNPEASSPLSDDEENDKDREGRDPAATDVEMTEM